MRVNFNKAITDIYGNAVKFWITPPSGNQEGVSRDMTLGDLALMSIDRATDHPLVKGKKRTAWLLQKAILEQPEGDSKGIEITVDQASMICTLVEDQQPPSVFGQVYETLNATA